MSTSSFLTVYRSLCVSFKVFQRNRQSVMYTRKSSFWTKFDKEKKMVDLNVLPPCKNNLKYHIIRSNYVAYMFRHANQLVLDTEKAENHGWDEEGEVCWSDECYPEEVSDFLLEKDSYTVVKIHLVIMTTANHILKMISTMMLRTSQTFNHCHYLGEKI